MLQHMHLSYGCNSHHVFGQNTVVEPGQPPLHQLDVDHHSLSSMESSVHDSDDDFISTGENANLSEDHSAAEFTFDNDGNQMDLLDHSIREFNMEEHRSKISFFGLTKELKHCLRLLETLDIEIGASLQSYNKIMQWAYDLVNEDGLKLTSRCCNRTSIENGIRNLLGENDKKHDGVKHNVPLESDEDLRHHSSETELISATQLAPFDHAKESSVINRRPIRFVPVHVFSFKDQLEDLLSDYETFSNLDNLVVNKDTPSNRFKKMMPKPESRFEEIVGGGWHNKAHSNLITDCENEFLAPVILYVDKTATTRIGRHNLEPVYFTLATLNQSARSKPDAWRPLGYLADLEIQFKHKKKKGIV